MKQCPQCGHTKWTKKIWTEVCNRCRLVLPYNLKDLVDVEYKEVDRGVTLIKQALREMEV
jgi:hypothetical protein